MNAENAQKLARRFIELPLEKRRLFLDGLREEGVDFSLFPIPGDVVSDERDRLSYAQQRMWFLWQLDPQSAAYNLPMGVRLNGELDGAALQSAFDGLVARHETLRSRFREQDGLARQYITEPFAVTIVQHDLSTVESCDREGQVRSFADAEALAPFDLASGPLLRVHLLKLATQEHVLLLTLHHIVADGWSYNVLIDEFIRSYDAACSGIEAALLPLPIQYRDYALWQRSWLESGEQERQLAYWRGKLGDDHPPLDLPVDHPRPLTPSYRGARHEFQIEPALAESLQDLAKKQGVTLFMVLLAAFKVLLHRYSGQQVIRVGVPVANRNRAEVERLIGCFINTQVLHTEIDPLIDVTELLQRIKETALGAQAHQELPFERLVEALDLDRSLSYSPLFQVLFNHQPQVADAAAIKSQSGLALAALQRESHIAQFDLTLDTYEQSGHLAAAFGYSTDLFDSSTVERMARHWRNLLQGIVKTPGQRIAELPLLSPDERQRIIYGWNRTEASYPSDQCTHQLIEDQAEKTPDAVAVVFDDQELTYQELNRKANQLAYKLRELGVGPDVLVGIAVEHSLEMVIGLLAILKAGGAYVPLDPKYPQVRLTYMIEDSGIQLLLTQSHLQENLPISRHIQILTLDQNNEFLDGYSEDNPDNIAQSENLAYVIYTSGSTGWPKGVAVRHSGLSNHMQWMQTRFDIQPSDRVLQKTAFSFDASVWEFWLPLLAGAQLHMASTKLLKDFSTLWDEVERRQITILQLVPSLLQALLSYSRPQSMASLRMLFCGGEVLSEILVRRLAEIWSGLLVNLYGPTEATIDSCFIVCGTLDSPPVGQPIDNARIYISSGDLNALPVGSTGELLISGAPLARGYHMRPALTAERFIPDPFGEQGGGRLYRTGDLARYRVDGVIEYVGRIDHQVKVRGFRIELGEIEARLQEHKAVREAVVIDIEGPSGKQLVGYLVAESNISDDLEQQGEWRTNLRDYLREVLPDYMVPAHLLFLDKLPLTPNGKLDRKVLSKFDASQLQKQYLAPQGELEQQIAVIWADVLKVGKVGLTDNFFELGGHSLLATQIISRIRHSLDIELPLRTLFENPVLADFAVRTTQGASGSAPALKRADREQSIPLSYAQQRQWFLWQLEPESAAYHLPSVLRLHGVLDIKALQDSFDSLIQRHESLRTTFCQKGEQAVQEIHSQMDFVLSQERLDVSDEALIRAKVEEEVSRPFDLEHGPLLRVRLLRLADDDHVLVLTLHHIVSDGWSAPIMVDELIQLYVGYSLGRKVQLPELPIQYADYAIWQRQWMEAGEHERQLEYWKAQLGGEQPILELPTDRPRPAIQSHAGARLQIELDSELFHSLKYLAQQQGVTLFMLLLASFQTLLHRYSGQDDIRVGIPNANRNRVETEGLIGFFVNTQVLKAEFDVRTTFTNLLQQVKRSALEAQAHQDLPFEQLVEALQPERSLSHNPLFQVMYNHQTQVRNEVHSLQGLDVIEFTWEQNTTHFDLALDTYEHEGGIGVSLNYATALFDRQTIERLAQYWTHLLEGIVREPQQRITELLLLSEQERQLIVYGWNRTAASYPSEYCIHQLIEEQVQRVPDAIALVFGEQVLSYRQLNQRANQLAHKLRELGIAPDVLVGIAVERSLEMVIGLLAILKTGGAYVPLDPEYPQDRLAYMIEDSGIQLLLTQNHLRDQLPIPEGVQSLCLDQDSEWLTRYSETDPGTLVHPENLAYVIYTSGSTGKPKGAGNTHEALVNRLFWMQKAYALSATDRVLQKTPFSFDVSVWEFFWPLLSGARLVLAQPGAHRDPEQLIATIRLHGVTTLHFVPSMLQAFLINQWGNDCESIRRVICSGEALPVELSRQVRERLPGAGLFNLYGPTEAAIDVTHWTCGGEDARGVPIGRPIDNLKTHILEGGLLPALQGSTGELYLGGVGLARGYHDRPALTAERFIPDPFSEQGGGRLYRTGDLARYQVDGVIEYAGRIDHQVKIRGFRIELGEIEERLHEHKAIREAIVIDIEGPCDKQLVGYLVVDTNLSADLEPQAILRSSLRNYLKEVLPDYMVPAHLLFLDKFPLTPNGKLDRKALPKPDVSQLQQDYVAPKSELEQQVAAIWADVLKVEKVGLTDNFFELGGDSIISIQVVSRARQAGIRFTPKELFQHQTVQGLVSVARRSSDLIIDQGPVKGSLPLIPIQQWFFEEEIPERHHWNQSVLLNPREPLDPTYLKLALQILLEHHDALRLRFERQQDHKWVGKFQDIEPVDVLWTSQLTDIKGLEQLAEEAQRSLSLEQGPLIRGVLVDLPDNNQRLLLVIHHLVVDGVSWRVLLEDLQRVYQDFIAGQAVKLPAKTSSFKSWSEHLQARAQSIELQQELDYWRNQLQEVSESLPCDRPDGGRQLKHAAYAATHLSKDLTRKLLQQASQAYRTQVNDLLLTALARVISRWTGQSDVLVRLEGHGREDLFEDIDLTRTVGWFTSMYPAKLSLQGELAASIKSIKEQLRAIPSKGIGYGLLRYLGRDETREVLDQLPQGEIVFNYLGQFDGSFDTEEGLFVPAQEGSGATQSQDSPLGSMLTLNGQVYKGELSLGWTFSREVFEEQTIQRLADEYAEELRALIEHCTSTETFGITPSDVPLSNLTQEQLDTLPIAAQAIEDIYPLSPMQQGMLFHTLYAQEGGDYINQMRVDVTGLDIDRFRQAWQAAVDHHEVLRASFIIQFEQPLQIIRQQVEMPFASLDWRAQPDLQVNLDTWAEADRQRGFDLLNDPLLRIAVIRTGENSHHLIYTSHHILMDGWSNSQLLGEVLQAYAGVQSTPKVGRYRDYIDWLQKQDIQQDETFWRDQFSELQEPTRLAQAIRQGKVDLGAGHGDHYQVLDQQQTQKLSEFARQQRVTVNTLVQAAWLLLLQRYTGQNAVAFGATVAGRHAELKGVEQQLGLFINTLPVIANPKPEQSVAQWIEQVKAQNLALREHEHTPLYEIQRWAGLGGEALFDNILVFENYPISEALQKGAPEGLKFSAVINQEQTNYPLTLAVGLADTLSVHYRYGREYFNEATVQGIAQHFGNLLQKFIENPQQALGELPLLSPEEKQKVIRDWNRTEAGYPRNQCVHQLIEAQVEKTPDAVAVVFGDQELSYLELDRRSNQLAHKLRELRVGPDVLVGIAVERSLEMVIGLLAILKAGGAYVPLDPEYPQERLAYMMEHSEARILLTLESLVNRIPAANAITWCLDRDWHEIAQYPRTAPDSRSDPENLVYCIYTSGSTGKPKGVTVRHRALVNFLSSMEKQPGLDANDRVLALTSLSFDIAGLEVYLSLMVGASLVLLADHENRDPLALLALIERQAVNTIQATPSTWRMLLDVAPTGTFQNCRLISGGEALATDLAERLLQQAGRAWNLYGPTETTIWSGAYCLDAEHTLPLLGKPIANTSMHLLDASFGVLPIGVGGELLIGGEGLARGYHLRPSLTAERFIPDPFDSSEGGGRRLYRTGDLARYHSDGVIEYISRIDHQVKVRGFRIELGEIEAHLLEHNAIREAVVVDLEGPNGRQLAAYLVSTSVLDAEQQHQLRSGLRDQLKSSLPDYMVPTHLLFLNKLPLTPNGKLDRKALPKPDASQLQQGYIAPQSELEQQIAAIWADVLKVEKVGLTDSFFELGGHSLLATQVISRIRQALNIELPLRTLFEASVLAEFVAHTGQGTSSTAPAFQRVDRTQPLVLSYAQQRQWFLWQLEPESTAYNMPTALRLKGDLNVEALRASFEALTARHESLRTTFRQEGGRVVQIIHPRIDLVLDQECLEAASEALIPSKIEEEVSRPFDLEHGPLLRVKLLQLAENDHVLILTLHHIVSDGWSMPIMVDELVRLYEGYRTGQQVILPELLIQYADYAIWQRQWMEAGEQERQLAYWKEQLGEEQPVLELPTDRPRPAIQNQEGANFSIELENNLAQSLKQLAQQQGVTLFMLLLASSQTLLHRYSGQDDVRVGITNANRNRVETERLIGFFVNTQVIKSKFDLGTTFIDLLKQVKQTVLEAQAHQDLPFEQLVEALHPERSLSNSPLFQVMYNHQIQVKGESRQLSGLKVEGLVREDNTAKYDLALDTFEHEQGIVASLSYATALFDKSTIERLAGHWINLLQCIVKKPSQLIYELPLLSPEEQQKIIFDWNRTKTSYPSDHRCIHQLIETQAKKTPDAIAVVFGDQELTYLELNRKANQLAHKLRELGVGLDVLVGIAVGRSLEMVIGLLAILKAGGAYVPLDPEYPQERLAYMVEDSGIQLLLTQSSVQDSLPVLPNVLSLCLDQEAHWLGGYGDNDLEREATYDSAAYVIFTSGSTGTPKGVTISHGAFAMHCQAAAQRYGITDRDCMLQFASISFDAAAEQIFMSLAFGLRLLVGEVKQWSVEQLLECVERHGVSILNLPPAYLAHLNESLDRAKKVVDIRLCILGGEAWSHGLLTGAIRARHIFNAYGPTEAVVTPLVWEMGPGAFEGYAPIGLPIGERSAYVLDEGGSLLPSNGSGELYLGGEGLARGYHLRAALTAERFIPNSFDNSEQGGGRLYRTGDLVRYRTDGVIGYLGRIDHQVKVRGFRIELGEIEAKLQSHETIREAVVINLDGVSGKQLVGYLVSNTNISSDLEGQGELRTSLRNYLRKGLPDYMVPAHLLFLEKLPLTPNGKLDRKALPKPDTSLLQQEYIAPQNELEQRVAAIWVDVLKVEKVGRNDSFFELGGHSLLAVQVVSQINEKLGFDLPLQLIFESPILSDFSMNLNNYGLALSESGLSDIEKLMNEMAEA